MDAIIIKADQKGNKILFDLAKKIGAEVSKINAEQYEDFIFGAHMTKAKTGINVSRNTIIKKLRKNDS